MNEKTVEQLNAEADAIDAQIAKLRAAKTPLAAARAAKVAEAEIQSKLRGMTSEQRRRIQLRPADGASTARK